jgi:hypothetical protein
MPTDMEGLLAAEQARAAALVARDTEALDACLRADLVIHSTSIAT